VAPDINGKQWAVTALGGTQTGVTSHSVASPFTITFWRPKLYKLLGALNSAGVISYVPRNVHKVVVRKGVTPAANQSATPLIATLVVEVPAGSDTYDSANVRAALSAMIGALNQVSAGIGDTAVTGIG
jgi:hypothetical protein